jgi:RimJ/RimL family protein N-acetyltransferase
MTSFTPQLQLETLFVLNDEGRIVSTRETNPAPGPAFSLIRDANACAWAIHVDVPDRLADELQVLARSEPPADKLSDRPRHADAYVGLLGGRIEQGPVFTFPATTSASGDVVAITELSLLERHFRGWKENELPECSPILGVVEDGYAVSVCFCARRTSLAAEAGVETAVGFRGRGLGSRVASAWARAIQDSGRLPLYSTSLDNHASLAVARRLALTARGSDWNLYR